MFESWINYGFLRVGLILLSIAITILPSWFKNEFTMKAISTRNRQVVSFISLTCVIALLEGWGRAFSLEKNSKKIWYRGTNRTEETRDDGWLFEVYSFTDAVNTLLWIFWKLNGNSLFICLYFADSSSRLSGVPFFATRYLFPLPPTISLARVSLPRRERTLSEVTCPLGK